MTTIDPPCPWPPPCLWLHLQQAACRRADSAYRWCPIVGRRSGRASSPRIHSITCPTIRSPGSVERSHASGIHHCATTPHPPSHERARRLVSNTQSPSLIFGQSPPDGRTRARCAAKLVSELGVLRRWLV